MGLFKSIKKVFKKVAKVAVKYAPLVLGAAAVVFTGGAALGLAPLGIAGGWGAAASSLVGMTGATGGIASVLTSTLTNAGFGAAIGAVGSGVTGGSITKGAGLGAAAGAVTGAVSGGFNAAMGPAAAPASGAPAPASTSSQLPSTDPIRTEVLEAIRPSDVAQQAAAKSSMPVAPAPTAAAPTAAAETAAPGGFSKFLTENQTLVGQTVAGLGNGLMQGLAAGDEQKALRKRDEERSLRFEMPDIEPDTVRGDTSGFQTPVRKYSRPGYSPKKRIRYRFDGKDIVEEVR